MKTIYLIRGLPGSGKSTLAEELTDGLNHVEADMYFTNEDGHYSFDKSELKAAHAWCQEQVELMMKARAKRIAVSNTFVRQWEMAHYKKLAREYDYTVCEIVMRNSYGNIHGVPNEKVLEMADKWED